MVVWWQVTAHRPERTKRVEAVPVAASDILSRFGAVLLDMNGTLMFGGDRFGPDQDYAATYRSLGGSRLAPEVVQATITACHETKEWIYNDRLEERRVGKEGRSRRWAYH